MAVAKDGEATLVCPPLAAAAGSTGALRGRAGRGMGERVAYAYVLCRYFRCCSIKRYACRVYGRDRTLIVDGIRKGKEVFPTKRK